MSINECIYWLRVVNDERCVSGGLMLDWGPTVAAVRSDVAWLRDSAKKHLAAVKWRRSGGPRTEEHARRDRINLVTWALCREAVRAIEAERAARRVGR